MKWQSLILLFLFSSCSHHEDLYHAERGLSSDNQDIYDERGYIHEYDKGPNVQTSVGKRYAELFAATPNYRQIGEQVLEGRGEKFRWKFGPMFYRGRLGKNQVKVLIIGQEGAQDENVSDRSFTGGTGGRMQNFLASMGLDRSYLFINTFVYTIKGQYSDYAPVYNPKTGKMQYKSVLKESMYRLAQTPESPIVKHRHELIDHVIDSNRDSLKLIVAVGGAAQDSLATYIMAKGGKCQPWTQDPSTVQRIRYGRVGAGGNRSFFYPVDKKGNNLLIRSADGNPKYLDYSNDSVQNNLKARLNDKSTTAGITRYSDGPMKNGFTSLFQLGANMMSCENEDGQKTLKGLDGISSDIRFIKVKHPGSNSPSLQKIFAAALKDVRGMHEADNGWNIPNDKNMKQSFDDGFKYTHKPVPRRDFRFGMPEVIGQGNTRTTRRHGGSALEIGGRGRGRYDRGEEKKVKEGSRVPNSYFYAQGELGWEPPKENFVSFDPGPGAQWSRIFTGVAKSVPTLDLKRLEKVMMQSVHYGAGQIYRGRPDDAKVLILADQHSHDDLWVGRALMGYEGQRLQGFLKSLGVGLDYAILRTIPVDTLGIGEIKREQALDETREWRKAVWKEMLKSESLKAIFTLGDLADDEIKSLETKGLPVISLTTGYDEALRTVRKKLEWETTLYDGPLPIAREDIPYAMRRWVGTAGNRMIRSTRKVSEGGIKHYYYKMYAPSWSAQMKPPKLSEKEVQDLKNAGLL